MKTSSIFRLGGIAVLLAAVLYGAGNLMYFLSGQPDTSTSLALWIGFFGDSLLLLGLGALYAKQSQQGGILALLGYVLLVVASLLFTGNAALNLGVSAGVLSYEQMGQVSSYNLATSMTPWIWFAGLVAFGIATYLSGVFPKYAGALLVLLAVLNRLTGLLSFTQPIFALVSFAAWAWLGWALMQDKRGAG